jgi:hypothetical protein
MLFALGAGFFTADALTAGDTFYHEGTAQGRIVAK